MRRREFIAGFAALSAPQWVHAQGRRPVVGFLSLASEKGYAHVLPAFRAGLAEAGYREGGNIDVEYRWAENSADKLPVMLNELIGRNVSVIVTAGGTGVALLAKRATTAVPVVFVVGGDPVESRLVTSLARPEGNLTGITEFSDVLLSKRMELLLEFLPKVESIGVLLNSQNPNAAARVKSVQQAALAMPQRVGTFFAAKEEEFDAVFAALEREKIAALIVQNDPLFNNGSARLAALSARYGIRSGFEIREPVAAGGLMSYGSSQTDGFRRAGVYAGRILAGAKPGELPVLRPTKFEMVLNLKTAQTLGVTAPPTLLAGADEIIE